MVAEVALMRRPPVAAAALVLLVGTACDEPRAREEATAASPAVRPAFSTPVEDTTFADTLTLDVGQVRAWNLAAGRYRFAVSPETRTDSSSALELGAEGVRCAPDRLDKSTIHCLLREPTRLVLKHTGVRSGAEHVHVTIVRVGE
jgi:hypothetical protein